MHACFFIYNWSLNQNGVCFCPLICLLVIQTFIVVILYVDKLHEDDKFYLKQKTF